MGRKKNMGNTDSNTTPFDEVSTISFDDSDQYRFRYGRRFHNFTNLLYDLPNDDDEADRLHLEHFLIRTVWQSNFSSPIIPKLESGCKGLDAGCGPGAWALEMALDYPKSKFVGVDISPIFPTNIKPCNLTFQVANILDGIGYSDGTFDFVHMRFMMPAFTQEQWEIKVIQEVVRVLAVGGWLELCEYELCQNCGPTFEKILNSRREMWIGMGINPDISQLLGKMMQNTNQFEEIRHDERIIPIGKSWAGKIGEVGQDDIITRMIGIKPALFPFMGITSEEYDEMMQQSIEEFDKYKTFFVTCRWYAKKIN
ncbi:hypothetical protein Glove_99g351 [Diversispora epigaea]|uniref:Methyltransferase domain-containing protein n=1 Tax=Diversispora epigaea TaxID=1348612 RepID=A0A397JD39_9GLOM|nr:hypothetical protein Glove_99g351 [Diversispora epigaea]